MRLENNTCCILMLHHLSFQVHNASSLCGNMQAGTLSHTNLQTGETITHRIRGCQMFLPLAMSTEASTMGIMLIDASAEAQRDTHSFKLSTTGNPRSECGSAHSHWFAMASRGWGWTNGDEGQRRLGGGRNTQVCILEHFP